MKYIILFLHNFLLSVSLIICWHIILKKRILIKNYKIYVSLIVISLITTLFCMYDAKIFKILILLIVFGIFIKYIFNEKISVCIGLTVYYEIIIMISETLYAVFLGLLFKLSAENAIMYYSDTLITDVAIGLITIIICKIKYVIKLFDKFTKLLEKTKIFQTVFLCLIVIISVAAFPYAIYYKVNYIYLIIFYTLIMIIFCLIVIQSFNTQRKYNKVSDKYNVAINSLKDYEDMMTKYRITNHENKNLLLSVRAMIINKEKNIPNYIDSIIKDKYDDDEKLLLTMNIIPCGGLRATIYSEILKIKRKNINYSLNIDSNLKSVDMINIESQDIINICKILGVFIDNAIEAVEKISKKHIEILIFADSSELNIKISNTYDGTIDFDKIYEPGYSTKSEGHGYGLAMVKNIVENNERFYNKFEISRDVFSQILCLKYNKK